MPVGTQGGNTFYFDGDAWTCPNCGHTFRSPQRNSERRDRQRRVVRDNHKCEGVLPK